MAKYQQYAEYKDSGVEWLGKIPHGWKVLRGKYVFQEFRERSTTGEEVLLSVSEYYGVKPRSEKISEGDHLSRAESLVDYKKCYKNDLVMNIMLAWKRGLGVSKYDGIVSPAYSVFRFNKDIHPYFMHHLFRTDLYTSHFKTRSTGVIDSRLRLYPESFLDTEILIPSYDEQAQIANFLDHETAQIDTLIEKQKTLIQLLKEKRQAVISHAVTKGLNTDAPMKDSGVEWLGEVPKHWVVATVRRIISRMEQGKSPQCESSPAKLDEWGVLKTSCVNGGNFQEEENKLLPSHIAPHEEYEVKAGDLLMSRASGSINLIGSVVLVQNNVRAKLLLSDKVFRIYLNKDYDSLFFTYLMSSSYMRSSIEVAISGAEGMANNIAKSSIMEFVIPILPIDEQIEIASYIEAIESKYSFLILKAEQAIQLMQERRTALISAAVTGKIDVRGWVEHDGLN